MTNHHVGSDMLAKLSTPQKNLLATGFYAKTRAEELKCPDLELNILWEIRDVTDRVKGAAPAGAGDADANTARRKMISTIEREAKEETKLQPEVVTLYQGGKYHLYLYKKFTDVRLVFAPEEAIAFFGGDTDNFEFPRFDLDCCFFRVYENDKPFHAENHLAWSSGGSSENELVFVFGHPGRTRRAFTLDNLKFLRDTEVPYSLRTCWRNEIKAQTFAGRSAENARIVRDDLFGVANSRKAYTGLMSGLADPALLAKKAEQEQALRAKIAGDPKLAASADAWDRLAKAKQLHREFFLRHRLLNPTWGVGDLFTKSRDLVRLAAESAKPSAERLPEFSDARMEALELELYSPAPIYDALEASRLEGWLSRLVEDLGGDDPAVAKALDGKSPAARAHELVAASTIKDPAARRKLAQGGAKAIESSSDPLIKLVAAIDPEARALRKKYEDEVESVERDSYAKIAAVRFAIEGDKAYPDATFTLRMSFGPVKGLTEDGKTTAPYTTFAGAFERAKERKGQEGFELPESWIKAKDKLPLETPFNFIFLGDIIGGNSGSPVVNRAGEVVGLIFDGNIHSLVGDLMYDPTLNRAVAVDSRGLMEALRSVYHADALVKELSQH
jgi:8-oxo-dGTP pyrophosphatase MutT (NUDIX family)